MARISAAQLEELAVEAAIENPYSTLPPAGNRMWERSYNRNLAAGEDKRGAAIHAWMHVRKFYRKTPGGKWVPRKKKAKRTKNPVTLRSVMSKALR